MRMQDRLGFIFVFSRLLLFFPSLHILGSYVIIVQRIYKIEAIQPNPCLSITQEKHFLQALNRTLQSIVSKIVEE